MKTATANSSQYLRNSRPIDLGNGHKLRAGSSVALLYNTLRVAHTKAYIEDVYNFEAPTAAPFAKWWTDTTWQLTRKRGIRIDHNVETGTFQVVGPVTDEKFQRVVKVTVH